MMNVQFTREELDTLKAACRDTVVARACNLRVKDFRDIYGDAQGIVLTTTKGKRFKFIDTHEALMGDGWWLKLPDKEADAA